MRSTCAGRPACISWPTTLWRASLAGRPPHARRLLPKQWNRRPPPLRNNALQRTRRAVRPDAVLQPPRSLHPNPLRGRLLLRRRQLGCLNRGCPCGRPQAYCPCLTALLLPATFRCRPSRRAMPAATGAPKPGSANENAACAPPIVAPSTRREDFRRHENRRDELGGGRYVVRFSSGLRGHLAADPDGSRCAPRRYFFSIASSPASSITGTLSSRALSSFEPASSPATT